MFLKDGVKIGGLQPEMVIGLVMINEVFKEHGAKLTITAVLDGKHMDGSLHYSGRAVDLRTKDMPVALVPIIASALKVRLGSGFDVVVEKTHVHVEFDPKDKK